MDDYSYGSGWAGGGGSSIDYGISPYAPGYSNQGFQSGQYNSTNSPYNPNGTDYSLGNPNNYNYSNSNNGYGFSAPSASGGTSNFSPYATNYSNQGFGNTGINFNSLTGDRLTQALKNNYGGKDSGGNYIPFPEDYYPVNTPPPSSIYDLNGYDSQGYNNQGFNAQGLNSYGLNNLGLRYDSSGRNYSDGGFNYDSGVNPFGNSSPSPTADTTTTSSELQQAAKEDLRKRLQGNGQTQTPTVSKGLEGLVSTLNSLFNNKSGGNSTAATIGGLYQGQQNAALQQQALSNSQAQQAFAQKQADTLASMFGPDSAYAQQLRSQLERKDAAAGRRSQYGPREVELQARLADMASRTAPSILAANGQAGQLNKDSLAYGQQGLATGGQQISRVLDLGQGLSSLFNSAGAFNNTRPTNYDSYDLQGPTNPLTGLSTGSSSYWGM